eukprot:gene13077-biopygen6426
MFVFGNYVLHDPVADIYRDAWDHTLQRIRCLAGFLNDPLDQHRANCKFAMANGRMCVETIVPIPAHDELILPYGDEYWLNNEFDKNILGKAYAEYKKEATMERWKNKIATAMDGESQPEYDGTTMQQQSKAGATVSQHTDMTDCNRAMPHWPQTTDDNIRRRPEMVSVTVDGVTLSMRIPGMSELIALAARIHNSPEVERAEPNHVTDLTMIQSQPTADLPQRQNRTVVDLTVTDTAHADRTTGETATERPIQTEQRETDQAQHTATTTQAGETPRKNNKQRKRRRGQQEAGNSQNGTTDTKRPNGRGVKKEYRDTVHRYMNGTLQIRTDTVVADNETEGMPRPAAADGTGIGRDAAVTVQEVSAPPTVLNAFDQLRPFDEAKEKNYDCSGPEIENDC